MHKEPGLGHRVLLLLIGILLFVLIASFAYQLGMQVLEGKERSYMRSALTVFESLSTTGYGFDNDWRHPAMGLYMLFLQVAGLGIAILAFPVYLVPLLERHLRRRLPLSAHKMRDHVLIYRHSRSIAALLPQLDEVKQAVLVMEIDEEEGRRVEDAGHNVIHREPDEDGLRDAGILRARTVIANGNDVENLSLALTARQMGYEGDIVAMVSDPAHEEHMRLVGCTAVLTPYYLLAAALAARASDKVSPTLVGVHQLGAQLEVRQIRIQAESELAGQTLQQAGVGKRTGAIVLGQWVGGKLSMEATADMLIEPRGILVTVGSKRSVSQLVQLAEGERPPRQGGEIVVIGFGEVGSQTVKLLRKAGETVLVFDREARDGVDLVGNILDPELLEQANIVDAQAVIIAIDSDDATLFATVVIRGRCDRVPILARVNATKNLDKIHRAGADYALSFSQISASLLSKHLLGTQSYELDSQLSLLKFSCRSLDDQKPVDMDIRGRTGCSIAAVLRAGIIFTRFDEDFTFESGDEVYICGGSDGIRKFEEFFQV